MYYWYNKPVILTSAHSMSIQRKGFQGSMKPYELTVLVHPDLEMNLDKTLDKIAKLVKENGGEIKNQENLGKKKMAYQINKQDFAVYVNFELDLPAQAPIKISNTLNITNDIMRYLLVKEDEKVKAARAESSEAKTEDKESEK